MRPVLLPAARRLWRDRTTLQLGRPGPGAFVLEGLDGPSRAVLSLLDGSRSREEVLAAPEGRPVLELLEGAGLVVDADDLTAGLRGLPMTERDRLAPDAASLCLVRGPAASAAMAARRSATVLVRGAGRVGAPLAALLAGAGVGAVTVQDGRPTRHEDLSVGGLRADDVGRTREVVLAGRLGPSGHTRQQHLVVLTDGSEQGQADVHDTGSWGTATTTETAALLLADGTPHLLVDVLGRTGVVGPLVLPGLTTCARCLELTRTDLDPGWPALSAQLGGPSRAAAVCDGVLAVAVAAQAALQVLEHLEGGSPAAVGGTLELELPGWRWRRRSWPVHPACSCAWTRPRRAA